MPTPRDVTNHYTHGDLATAIRDGIESLGKKVESVTVDDAFFTIAFIGIK